MVSLFVKVPARIQELHSLYFIHIVDPNPSVAWLARYSHHFFLGITLSLGGSSSFFPFLPSSASLQTGSLLHKSSSVSLTPSPSANFFIVSLFVFQQFLEPSDGKIRNGTFQACNSESTISRLYIDHHIQDLIWQVQEALHLSTDLCVQTL